MIEFQIGDTGDKKEEFRGGQAPAGSQWWPLARGDMEAREWLGLSFLLFAPQTLPLDPF